MSTRLYFHDASNTLTGTFPTGEQSSRAATWTATGANTLRTMNNRVGISQASLTGTMLNNTNAQNGFMGFFCSPPLKGNQSFPGGLSFTLNIADAESNLNANAWVNSLNIYIWRPSTGTKIGTAFIDNLTSAGGTEATAANSEQVTTFNFANSLANTVNALDGDVIICEIWTILTQTAMSSGAYTFTIYYDGTTENLTENTVVSSQSSFLEIQQTLYFEQLAGVSVGHPFMF